LKEELEHVYQEMEELREKLELSPREEETGRNTFRKVEPV
jgi:hypothetical protein